MRSAPRGRVPLPSGERRSNPARRARRRAGRRRSAARNGADRVPPPWARGGDRSTLTRLRACGRRSCSSRSAGCSGVSRGTAWASRSRHLDDVRHQRAGAFLLGALVVRRPLEHWSRPLLGTGVLGGFTTMSGLAVQAVDAAPATAAGLRRRDPRRRDRRRRAGDADCDAPARRARRGRRGAGPVPRRPRRRGDLGDARRQRAGSAVLGALAGSRRAPARSSGWGSAAPSRRTPPSPWRW